MEDCYKILGVSPKSSAAEIRRAYRIKAKQLHPDTAKKNSSVEAFRKLVKAYEILSDVKQRSLFDEAYFYKYHSKYYRSTNSFDYRDWLIARNDEESRAKLIFFDLLHQREDDAVAEFIRMSKNHSHFSLSKWFTREDFMDYGFILCEELVLREEYYDAFVLLEQIIRMEHGFNYFRLFFPEVMDLARTILKFRIENKISDELCLDAWERALELNFGSKDDSFFLQKMALAYRRLGDEKTARICEEESVRIK
ncbi:J domain-containing protein [Treponema pectinovorum]|uniref:J domain-containing protein n=1 Tax=Treponema pectinovorum TaxID=164 RepID=UPI0011C980E9|nr:J domain-containing protein [Treponema pectinovorum]